MADTELKWDVEKEMDEMFNERELPLEKFDEAVLAVADKEKKEQNLFMMKGEVTELELARIKPYLKIQDEGGIDSTPTEVFVKIPQNLLKQAEKIAPFSICTVIGQIWKLPGREGQEDLRGVTVKAIWSDEDIVIAPTVDENSTEPEEELPEEEFS